MRAVPRFLVPLLIALAGCSGPVAKPPATVRGRVLYQGQPLAGGTIVFAPHPDRGPVGPMAFAMLDEHGTFRLNAAGSPYILAGWYRVAIADPPAATYTSFPPALRRPDRSGLDREVTAGRENVFEFVVELPAR